MLVLIIILPLRLLGMKDVVLIDTTVISSLPPGDCGLDGPSSTVRPYSRHKDRPYASSGVSPLSHALFGLQR